VTLCVKLRESEIEREFFWEGGWREGERARGNVCMCVYTHTQTHTWLTDAACPASALNSWYLQVASRTHSIVRERSQNFWL